MVPDSQCSDPLHASGAGSAILLRTSESLPCAVKLAAFLAIPEYLMELVRRSYSPPAFRRTSRKRAMGQLRDLRPPYGSRTGSHGGNVEPFAAAQRTEARTPIHAEPSRRHPADVPHLYSRG